MPVSLTTNPKSLNVETLRKSKGSSRLQRPGPAHRNGMHQKAGSPCKSVPSSHQTLVTFMWLRKSQVLRERRGDLGPPEGWGGTCAWESRPPQEAGLPSVNRGTQSWALAPSWDKWHFGPCSLFSLFFLFLFLFLKKKLIYLFGCTGP